jgi:hypothetical protein
MLVPSIFHEEMILKIHEYWRQNALIFEILNNLIGPMPNTILFVPIFSYVLFKGHFPMEVCKKSLERVPF